MPSTRLALPLAIFLLAPMSSRAQHLSSEATVAVTVTVQPSVAIRAVTPAAPQFESETRLTAPAIVVVESNLPYRLAVRLAPTHAPERSGVRVLVRGDAGTFEELLPGRSITAAVGRTAGRRGHEVVCRVETAATGLLDAGPCALLYEVSAEHRDALLRATAVLQECGARMHAFGTSLTRNR